MARFISGKHEFLNGKQSGFISEVQFCMHAYYEFRYRIWAEKKKSGGRNNDSCKKYCGKVWKKL